MITLTGGHAIKLQVFVPVDHEAANDELVINDSPAEETPAEETPTENSDAE